MTSELKDGFNKYVSNQVYHGDRTRKSSSALKLILKDPRKYYKTYVLNETTSEQNDAFSVGSYIHACILEPEMVDKEFHIFTGSQRRGNAWEDCKEQAGSKTIITSSQKYLVDSMIEEYKKAIVYLGDQNNEVECPVSNFFTGGSAEETLCGVINDYKVKVRFDYRVAYDSYGHIADLKTTNKPLKYASKREVELICADYGYDISCALYLDVLAQFDDKPYDFYFIFLSKADKGVRIFKASKQMIEAGREKYLKAIELLKEAEASGIYYVNKVEELDSI